MAEFSFEDTERVLSRLAEDVESVVLVDGQALNFWVEQFKARAPELREPNPFTSNDVDFLGDVNAANRFASRLNGKAHVADAFDPTPNAAVVVFADHKGENRCIDFLKHVFGLDRQRIIETSIPISLIDADGKPSNTSFRILNPVLCMESRVHNSIGLPLYYGTPHGLNQMRASIVCAREYLRELLQRGDIRSVLRANEQIFRFVMRNHNGRRAYEATGIDPFGAVVHEPPLPDRFINVRYPQMKQSLAARRRA